MAYNSLPSYILTYRILLSTIRLGRMVPLSPEKKTYCMLSLAT